MKNQGPAPNIAIVFNNLSSLLENSLQDNPFRLGEIGGQLSVGLVCVR